MLRLDMRSAIAAFTELSRGLTNYNLWGYLGWNDVRQRYRRSALGPFWLTITTGITVAAIGLLYGMLFGQPIREFLPRLAVCFVAWIYVSTTLQEASFAIISAEHFIRQTSMPITVYIVRVVWRNLIVFAHNLLIVVAALALSGVAPSLSSALFLVGLAIITALLLAVSVVIAIVCTRFRDLPMLIMNCIQLLFYVTPILWTERVLPDGFRWVVEANPLFHLFELLRAPAFGEPPALRHVVVALTLTALAYLAAGLLLARTRRRIAYWL